MIFRRRRPRHVHSWTYTPSIAGWTIARCDCGEVELA